MCQIDEKRFKLLEYTDVDYMPILDCDRARNRSSITLINRTLIQRCSELDKLMRDHRKMKCWSFDQKDLIDALFIYRAQRADEPAEDIDRDIVAILSFFDCTEAIDLIVGDVDE